MEKDTWAVVSIRLTLVAPLSMHWWRAENQPLRIANYRRGGSRSAKYWTICEACVELRTDMAKSLLFLAAPAAEPG